MEQTKGNLKKGCILFLVIYVVYAILFCLIAQDQMRYSGTFETLCGTNEGKNIGPLLSGESYTQTLSIKGNYITGAEIYFMTFARENTGTITVSLKDQGTGVVYAEEILNMSDLKDGSWQNVSFHGFYDTRNMKQPAIEVSSSSTDINNTVTMAIQENANVAGQSVYKGNQELGRAGLCMKVMSTNESAYYGWYIPCFCLLFLFLVGYCWRLVQSDKKGTPMLGLKFIYIFRKYRFLMEQLISRDFKTKYKRSVLGVLWSFLNPLLMMLVQYVVFSNLFKFDIPYYAVYLLSGIVLYSGFSEMTTAAMTSITGNAALITKVYVPKYIYPISKVLSTAINTLLSMLPLLLVALLSGVRFTPALVLAPIGLICFIGFVIGVSFALSSFMVFFRDVQFLWSVFTTMWMYATPIMYPLDILPDWLIILERFNPLYTYILFLRTVIIDGVSPNLTQYLTCFLWAFFALVLGGWIFKKTQDRFVLYI